MTATDQRTVAAWLLVCAALVFAMVVVGGVTRLTHSGLSIVEWQPLVGTLPPLSEGEWRTLFEKYQQTPEFKQVNFDMDLAGFKGIFWWEYFHRLLGRTIGLVFLLPFLWFLLRRRLDARLAWQLGGVFLLGALQGALGWYMVASGLVDNPRVSHFRLTAHLGMALAIFAAELWLALRLLSANAPATGRLGRPALALAALVFVMALSGGFVAGLRAGYAYNSFPLMNGHLVPPEILMLEPWWQNFLYNFATVQFVHRGIGWLLIFLVPWLWWRARREAPDSQSRLASNLLLVALALQVTLGIVTLVNGVPLVPAAAHQGGAVVLLGVALWVAHALRSAAATRPAPQSGDAPVPA
ncbi:MAG: heme A synthase [Betaproteobacteria bacterium SG8_39]|nr:MAG: heme A synthase [Betaproteobacteria bacterium SG8_39]